MCVAITRGGHGDIWLFETRTEAYLHPLVQYGDALLLGPDDIVRQYPRPEWEALILLSGLPHGGILQGSTPRQARITMEANSYKIWDALTRRATRPPLDPRQICDMVSRDRRLGTVMAKKKDTAPADATVAVQTETAERAAPARGPKNVPQDATISFGVDKEGKHFGPDNNPKKVGSKTHSRFAEYKHGMTIAEALAAGLTTADLVYDRDHGFVIFHGGTHVAKDEKAQAEEFGAQDDREEEAA